MSTGPTSIMKVHMILVGAIFLVFGVALSILLSIARVQPLIEEPVKLVQGVSIFAVAYLDAQFIERIVEPFTMLGGDSDRSNAGKADGSDRSSGSKKSNDSTTSNESTKIRVFGNWQEIGRLEQLEQFGQTAATVRTVRTSQKEQHEQQALETQLTLLKNERMFSIWGFSSFLGMLLAYFTFGLFAIVGITINPIGAVTGHAFDAIISGVIIGGGTKPLHDVIEYLQDPKGKS
jgi:hypothetical protein